MRAEVEFEKDGSFLTVRVLGTPLKLCVGRVYVVHVEAPDGTWVGVFPEDVPRLLRLSRKRPDAAEEMISLVRELDPGVRAEVMRHYLGLAEERGVDFALQKLRRRAGKRAEGRRIWNEVRKRGVVCVRERGVVLVYHAGYVFAFREKDGVPQVVRLGQRPADIDKLPAIVSGSSRSWRTLVEFLDEEDPLVRRWKARNLMDILSNGEVLERAGEDGRRILEAVRTELEAYLALKGGE